MFACTVILLYFGLHSYFVILWPVSYHLAPATGFIAIVLCSAAIVFEYSDDDPCVRVQYQCPSNKSILRKFVFR
jgi:hypothetical protein